MHSSCYDEWTLAQRQDRSCAKKAQAGACSTVLEQCGKTCRLCTDGLSLANAISARRLKASSALQFSSSRGMLRLQGREFHLRGVNMVASEASAGLPSGLRHRSLPSLFHWLQGLGINAIRLPFSHGAVLRNDVVRDFDASLNPQLVDASYLDSLVVIAQEAERHGILVQLASHRIDDSPDRGLWYSNQIREVGIMQSWSNVSHRLCGQWNVMGADLQNEPWAATWGDGNVHTDWKQAASRLGNRLIELCDRWLVFVEGIGWTPKGGSPLCDSTCASLGAGRGENVRARPQARTASDTVRPVILRLCALSSPQLMGVRTMPIELSRQDRLVYSPHTFGPSMIIMDYMKNYAFPGNVEDMLERNFGFIAQETGQATVVGAIGGTMLGLDRRWQEAAIAYFARKGFGVFYFALVRNCCTLRAPSLWLPSLAPHEQCRASSPVSLALCPRCAQGPDFEDTGGLLKADWWTPEQDKIELLQQLPGSNLSDFVSVAPKPSLPTPPYPSPPLPPSPSPSPGQMAQPSQEAPPPVLPTQTTPGLAPDAALTVAYPTQSQAFPPLWPTPPALPMSLLPPHPPKPPLPPTPPLAPPHPVVILMASSAGRWDSGPAATGLEAAQGESPAVISILHSTTALTLIVLSLAVVIIVMCRVLTLMIARHTERMRRHSSLCRVKWRVAVATGDDAISPITPPSPAKYKATPTKKQSPFKVSACETSTETAGLRTPSSKVPRLQDWVADCASEELTPIKACVAEAHEGTGMELSFL